MTQDKQVPDAPWIPKGAARNVGNPFKATRDAVKTIEEQEAAAREAKLEHARENPDKKLGEPG